MHDGYIGVIYKKLLIKDLKQGRSYYRSGLQRRTGRNGPRRQGQLDIRVEKKCSSGGELDDCKLRPATFTTFTKKLKYTSPYSTNILLTTALIALDIWILLTRCKLKFTCGNLETLNIFEKNYI